MLGLKLDKPLKDQKGIIGDIVQNAVNGFGAGTFANLADKKLLKGKLSSLGFPLGQSINSKPITLNATDALTVAVVNGIKIPKTKDFLAIGITLAIKKWAEAMDYIDPFEPMDLNDSNATNVTRGRHQRDGITATQQPQNYSFGGNY